MKPHSFRAALRWLVLALSVLLISPACQQPSQPANANEEIIVATAANLSDSFPEITLEFTKQTGIQVVLSFGATADLAKQIENGAPFDVFASADVSHVSALEKKNVIAPGTVSRYARGSLVVWVPAGSKIKLEGLEDLTRKEVERVAIAKPDIAPYGQAAVESLKVLNLWQQVEPKVVYGMNVSQVRQFVSSGNAEVGFLPRSLVQTGQGTIADVDEKLHQPIDQALGIVRSSSKQESARRFTAFVLGPDGQRILQEHGYKSPT